MQRIDLFMSRFFFTILIIFLTSVKLDASNLLENEENFLFINCNTSCILQELGPHNDEPTTPCSTFKIVLSLMGFDTELLKNKKQPCWPYKEGYNNYLSSWESPQTPESWMQYSCVWYSQLLANHLGLDKIKNYLRLFEYGNQDVTGGLTNFWLSSSLKISPRNQVNFLQKLLCNKLPISPHANQMTKELLFITGKLEGNWKLYGKTGLGHLDDIEKLSIGWFVGWLENGIDTFIFSYNIRGKNINPAKRIARVIELLQKFEKNKYSI